MTAPAAGRTGAIEMPALSDRRRISLEQRFWAKVDRSNPDGCWLWTGPKTSNGYGTMLVRGRNIHAHRVAWFLATDQLPADRCVCHRCDVKLCVRHEHHFLGTKRDNAQDMARKGRAHLQRDPMSMAGDRHWTRRHPGRFAGTCNPAAKLSPEQVIEIRQRFAAGETYDALKAAFGISTGNIGFIVKGQHWPHVGGPIATGRRQPGPRRVQ